MKGIRLVLTAAVGAILFAFVCACSKSNGQGLELYPNAAKPAGAATPTGETNPVGVVGEGQLGDGGQLTAPGGAKLGGTSETMDYNPDGHARLPDGTMYKGETIGGVPFGRGTVADLRGSHQQGEWRNGKPYRLSGTWVEPDGTKEEGTWNFDGSKSGGTITWTDGRVYKGDWKIVDGAPELPDGSGTMTYPDGRKYVGQFQDGRRQGKGVMHYPDGKIEDGLWNHGRVMGAAK